jgi:hypothetical protein
MEVTEMAKSNTETRKKSIRDALNEIAARVRQEREDTTVRTYRYKEENGYFSVSLTPVEKKRA